MRNIKSPEQVKTLIAGLKRAAVIPLFVAVDQEGGRIRRLKKKFGFPETRSHQYTGGLKDEAATARNAAVIADMLSRRIQYELRAGCRP